MTSFDTTKVVVDEMVEQSAPDFPGAQAVTTVADSLYTVEVDRRVLVSLTVVVRVMVLRVVKATWLPSAGAGVAPGADCAPGVCPFSAGGAADPCSAAACEMPVSGLAWFCATGWASPFLSVGKAAGDVDDPEAFTSVSVLYREALDWPYSIDVVAACSSEGGTIANDGCGAPLLRAGALGLSEDAGFCDCVSEPPLGRSIVDEPGGGALSSGAGALGLLGDAFCEDCCCVPSLGGMIVDKGCDCGGALSVG